MSPLEEPELPQIEGSEIAAVIDHTAVGNDHIRRPIFIRQDDTDFLNITIEDAKRLLSFLEDAIPFLEAQIGATHQ